MAPTCHDARDLRAALRREADPARRKAIKARIYAATERALGIRP